MGTCYAREFPDSGLLTCEPYTVPVKDAAPLVRRLRLHPLPRSKMAVEKLPGLGTFRWLFRLVCQAFKGVRVVFDYGGCRTADSLSLPTWNTGTDGLWQEPPCVLPYRREVWR